MHPIKPHLRAFEEKDIEAIVDIAEAHFGHNYLNKTSFLKQLQEAGTHAFVLENQDKVIAFNLLILLPRDAFVSRAQVPQITFEFLPADSTILCIKTIAVHPAFLKMGIGHQLIEKSLNEFKDQYQCLVSLNWKRKQDVPMSGLSRKLGMKPMLELKEFWKEQSIKQPYDCPECGQPPCTCNMIIYSNRLDLV